MFMNHYRLYFLTNIGGHIDHFEAIEANGDGAAIEVAKLYRGAYPLELWQRERRIEAFDRTASSLAQPMADNIGAARPPRREGQ